MKAMRGTACAPPVTSSPLLEAAVYRLSQRTVPAPYGFHLHAHAQRRWSPDGAARARKFSSSTLCLTRPAGSQTSLQSSILARARPSVDTGAASSHTSTAGPKDETKPLYASGRSRVCGFRDSFRSLMTYDTVRGRHYCKSATCCALCCRPAYSSQVDEVQRYALNALQRRIFTLLPALGFPGQHSKGVQYSPLPCGTAHLVWADRPSAAGAIVQRHFRDGAISVEGQWT